MFNRNELKGFWDSILIKAASRTALEILSQNLIVYTTDREEIDGSHYYTPRTEIIVERTILPGYFKDRFLDKFRPVVNVLEHCGIYFSVCLFGKFVIGVVVMILRYMEIDKITGSTLGFGKTL